MKAEVQQREWGRELQLEAPEQTIRQVKSSGELYCCAWKDKILQEREISSMI